MIETLFVSQQRLGPLTASPFTKHGLRISVEIERVRVWSSAAGPQIESCQDEAPVSIFALSCLIACLWWESRTRLDPFVTGITYGAGSASGRV